MKRAIRLLHHYRFMCLAIVIAARNMGIYRDHNFYKGQHSEMNHACLMFPELEEYKPKGIDDTKAWFPDTTEGYKIRQIILRELKIKLRYKNKK